MIKDCLGFIVYVFSLAWNIIDWQSVNVIFTVIISFLTIIYLIVKIRSTYLYNKQQKLRQYPRKRNFFTRRIKINRN